MRKPPDAGPAPLGQPVSLGRFTREYEIITPLLGGGVDAGKNDLYRLVREEQISGLLRVWWRVCRGGESVAAMRTAEAEIWGSSNAAGKVGFSVTITNNGRELVPAFDVNVPGYAAFALRETDVRLRERVRFRIDLTFPEAVRPDVESAVWAWETFGGVGARTRRGFGAVSPVIDGPSRAGFRQWLSRELERHVTGTEWPSGVFHLSKDAARYATHHDHDQSVLKAWLWGDERLKQFRQKRTGFHRSHWPEPDEVRRLTKVTAGHHPDHPVRAFPRGQFGLPIIFDFLGRANEPQKTILEGGDFDRMPSPLILRPFRCSDGAMTLAVGLEGDYARDDLLLKDVVSPSQTRGTSLRSRVTDIEAAGARTGTTSPLVVQGRAYTDAIQAFLNSL